MKLLAIAAGGALGALARYGAGLLVTPSPRGFPWPTFGVNIIGSFVAGIAASVLVERASSDVVSAALVIGFLGAFTTFSAFAVQTEGLLSAGVPVLAVVYVCASVLLGIGAAWSGVLLGRAVA